TEPGLEPSSTSGRARGSPGSCRACCGGATARPSLRSGPSSPLGGAPGHGGPPPPGRCSRVVLRLSDVRLVDGLLLVKGGFARATVGLASGSRGCLLLRIALPRDDRDPGETC